MNPTVDFIGRNMLAPLLVFWGERLWGWRMLKPFPDIDKFMILAEYHTSNWDVLVLAYAAAKERRRLRFVIKQEAENWFLVGRILKWGGAIFIDRDSPLQAIKTIVKTVRNAETCILVICPSGTRRYSEGWQPGFYYLAQKLKLPLVPGAPDYRKHQVIIGDPVTPSGDLETDLQRISPFFDAITARHPERATPIRLLPEVKHHDKKAVAI